MSTSFMKAIGFRKKGSPEVFEVLQVPVPRPGPYDLLVEVKAVGINSVDCMIRKTTLLVDKTHPMIPGYDATGIVIQVGQQVTNFNVGDEIYYSGNPKRFGTYAQYHVVDSRIVGPRPTLLSYAESAGIPLNAITAWEALIDRMKIPEDPTKNEGKTLLVTPGSGGVGSMAIQIAKKVLGLTVIASTNRQDGIEWVKKCGADYVVDSSYPLLEEIEKIGIWQVDYILHCWELTQDTLKLMGQIIKPFGIIGTITTRAGQADEYNLFNKNVSLIYEIMFERPMQNVELERQGQILAIVSKLLDEKILISIVKEIKIFNLSNLRDAHTRIEKGEIIGKIALDQVDLV